MLKIAKQKITEDHFSTSGDATEDHWDISELPRRTLLKPGEVALFFGISERTVYRWFKQGLLEGVRVSKSLRIMRRSIVSLLEKSQAEA